MEELIQLQAQDFFSYTAPIYYKGIKTLKDMTPIWWKSTKFQTLSENYSKLISILSMHVGSFIFFDK